MPLPPLPGGGPVPRVKKLGADERRTLRHELHNAVAVGGMPWSDAIRRMRRALGMTQDQFAKAFRLTKRQVVSFEAGSVNPTVETLARLGKPFGFEVGFIRKPTQHDAAQAEQMTGVLARVRLVLSVMKSGHGEDEARFTDIGPADVKAVVNEILEQQALGGRPLRSLRIDPTLAPALGCQPTGRCSYRSVPVVVLPAAASAAGTVHAVLGPSPQSRQAHGGIIRGEKGGPDAMSS